MCQQQGLRARPSLWIYQQKAQEKKAPTQAYWPNGCPCAPILDSPSCVLLLCVVGDGQSPWSSQVKHCDSNPAMAEQACICRLTPLLLLEMVPQEKQLGEVL